MAASRIELLAPAKLNVHLGIHPGRDERGYHKADSVMVGVALADRMIIQSADALSLITSVDCGVPQERNTVFRAARALCQAFGRPEGYAIHVQKNVPSQAGMGGASSDAASVLLGLCTLWDQDPLDERVVAVARGVGADVPFFLTLNPALLTGAGDVLAEEFLVLPDVPIALVRPDAGVSTVEAYRAFDEDPIEPPSPEAMCAALRASDAAEVAAALYNNLEPAANRWWQRSSPGREAACSRFARATRLPRAWQKMRRKQENGGLVPQRRLARGTSSANIIVRNGTWLSLVERSVRDREAAGSNPVVPTRLTRGSLAVRRRPFLQMPQTTR